jgi:hypothetical protein
MLSNRSQGGNSDLTEKDEIVYGKHYGVVYMEARNKRGARHGLGVATYESFFCNGR